MQNFRFEPAFSRLAFLCLIGLVLSSMQLACLSAQGQRSQAANARIEELSLEAQEGLQAMDLSNTFAYLVEETRTHGGITYDVKGMRKVAIGEKAYAVSFSGGTILPSDAANGTIEEAIKTLLTDYADDFWARGYMLGTWIESEKLVLHIDRTFLLHYSPESRDETLRSVIDMAKREKQVSIFDVSTGQSIPID